MSDVTWKHAETIAQILSAVGTLAAVLVSLHLARRQTAARLRARATLGHLVAQGVPGYTQKVLNISIANASQRDVTIESFGWRIGRLRRSHYFQTLASHPLAGKLPVKLVPSERTGFMFPWEEYVKNSSKMRSDLGRSPMRRALRSRSMRLMVSLSTGEYLSFPISRELRTALMAAPVNAETSDIPDRLGRQATVPEDSSTSTTGTSATDPVPDGRASNADTRPMTAQPTASRVPSGIRVAVSSVSWTLVALALAAFASGQVTPSAGVGVAVGGVLVVGLAAYWLRQYHRLGYGIVELVVGVAVGLLSFVRELDPAGKQALGFIGAVYLMVRALDNIGRGSRRYQWGRSWDAVFGRD